MIIHIPALVIVIYDLFLLLEAKIFRIRYTASRMFKGNDGNHVPELTLHSDDSSRS
jgi:hypothetical protein